MHKLMLKDIFKINKDESCNFEENKICCIVTVSCYQILIIFIINKKKKKIILKVAASILIMYRILLDCWRILKQLFILIHCVPV